MMMKKIVLWFVLLYAGVCIAADGGFSQLEEKLSNFNSMKANFKQRIYDDYGNTMQSSMGSMAIKRPGQFRWYTKAPTEQLILSDGHKLWTYDIDLEQATIRPFELSSESLPALLLTGTVDDLEQQYDITVTGQDTRQVFRLTPKHVNNETTFQSIELHFKENKIAKMRLEDNLNQQTELDFTSVKINPAISPSLFEFQAPPGVDIIDSTKET